MQRKRNLLTSRRLFPTGSAVTAPTTEAKAEGGHPGWRHPDRGFRRLLANADYRIWLPCGGTIFYAAQLRARLGRQKKRPPLGTRQPLMRDKGQGMGRGTPLSHPNMAGKAPVICDLHYTQVTFF
jgi:hypothetical protein